MNVRVDYAIQKQQTNPLLLAQKVAGDSGDSTARLQQQTVGTLASQDNATHESKKDSAENTTNKALRQALNPADAVLNNPINATAGRTTTQKEDKKSAYERDKARFENKNIGIGDLLKNVDSGLHTELVSYYKVSANKTRNAIDDKYLPQRFQNERNSALLALSSGAVNPPNSKKTEFKNLDDIIKNPLTGEKSEPKEEGFISYTVGKAKQIPVRGELFNMIS